MEHVYEIVNDKRTERKIGKLSKNLYTSCSESVDSIFKHRVNDLVLPIIKYYDVKISSIYGDMFPVEELLRFKYTIHKTDKYKDIVDTIDKLLSEDFKLRQVSYVETEDSVMILIWM